MSSPAPAHPELAAIEARLHEAIGLDCGTIGATTLAYAVRHRLAATGVADEGAYARRIDADPTELQELINAIVVPETWFFRDPRAFDAMTEHLKARQARALLEPPRGPFRLLSLPCSTGEEAYSMAMALLDAGLRADDFVIDAIDVSSRNIAEARRAIYGRNSFRGRALDFRARHFEAVEGGHRPQASVRAPVRLRTGNLFDPALLMGEAPYDVIFCRNLLIYFDRADQKRALERLGGLLAPDGLLLMGPAESGLPLLHGYASLRAPLAFAFTRAPAPSLRPASEPRPVTAARRVPATRPPQDARSNARTPAPLAATPGAPTAPRAAPPPAAVPSVPHGPDTAERSLAAIEAAADQGRLDAAKEAARRHIASFGPSAEVFYLIGLACDAGKDMAGAAEHYRKALYLTPDHREALAHLALLLRRTGDIAGADRLRARLERLPPRGDG